MCAEGLDIRSLSMLCLSTPKTDVLQSVGRILRVRHEEPYIIDIVDMHQVFKNQWQKRKSYYKQSGYSIHPILSHPPQPPSNPIHPHLKPPIHPHPSPSIPISNPIHPHPSPSQTPSIPIHPL
jgi:hypothetical protein